MSGTGARLARSALAVVVAVAAASAAVMAWTASVAAVPDPQPGREPSRAPAAASMKDVSGSVPDAALRAVVDSDGAFAKPGGEWNPTDVLSSRALPRRRLLWVVRDDERFVIHFEQGGFAHTYHVAVVRILAAGRYRLDWQAHSPRCPDYADFVRALEADEVEGRRRF